MSDRHRIGLLEICPAERHLTVNGRPVELGARAFDLLVALIERRDRLVARSELLDLVWPGLVVEDNNLAVQVSALRKVLGRAAIATVPGLGYRFAMATATPEDATTASEGRSTQSQLQATLEPLFGRDDATAELASLIDTHRLVTVVGPGGIGKTRLVWALADARRMRYPDGVWVIELAAVADPLLVGDTLARGLGLPAGQGGTQPIANALRDFEALVVLDNCEHLLDGVAALTQALLQYARRLTVVATSQQPLHVERECIYHLDSLALPVQMAASQAREHPTVQLFHARAVAVSRHFEVDDGNVGAVIEICRALDGIPLAIELAAARVALLGVEGLRARLNDRLRLLTAGRRDALPKHQTLRAALDWSHSLLAPLEQTVLRRLGVFVGTFRLAAAQQVAADAIIDDWAVIEHLGALVDKSLVIVDAGAEPRYRLLETTRLFALERLAAAGELDATKRRHALSTLAALEALEGRRWSITSAIQFQQLEPELGNVRAALSASMEGGDTHTAIRLGSASLGLWDTLALSREGLAQLLRLEPLVRDSVPDALQARYWTARTWLLVLTGAPIGPLDAGQHAVTLARRTGQRTLLYTALTYWALVAVRAGRHDDAATALAEAVAIEDPVWPPRLRALRWFATGDLHEAGDALEDAILAARVRIELLHAAGEFNAEHTAQCAVACLEAAGGDRKAAIARCRRAFEAGARSRMPRGAERRHMFFAALLIASGELEEGVALLRRGLPLLELSDARWEALDTLSALCFERGDAARAARVLGCADHAYKCRGRVRGLVGRRARDALLERIASELTPEECQRQQAAGAWLSEEDAVRLWMDGASPGTGPAPDGVKQDP